MADPRAPQQGSSAMGVGHGRALQTQGLGHPTGEPLGWAGGPVLDPRQFVFSTSFDVFECLEGQTTSESYETRTVAPVPKIASQRFENHLHTSSVRRENRLRPRKRAQKSRRTPPGRPPRPPTGELGHVGRPWPSPADAAARPSHGRAPVKAGDPLLGPRQPVSAISFDVSRCLEDQTTSKSYETRTVASVSKRASQRFKNHVDTTSVLREKPRKPKETRSKERTDDAWPTPEPPSRGARPCESAMAEPRRHRGSAIPWPSPRKGREPPAGSPTARFDDTFRRFDMFGRPNDLRILRNKDRCVRIE